MKKLLMIISFCIVAIGATMAQSNTAITYSMGFGTGDLGDFISKTSFRGATVDFRKMVNTNIGVGASLGWNVFYEEMAYGTYTIDNTSLSGKQFRYSNHVPMLLSASYYFKPEETIDPFVGLGVGTIYTRRNTDMNLYTLEQEAWNFALQPEIGVHYMLSDVAALTVSAKYYYGFKAGNDLTSPQSYFALNVGIALFNK